MMDLTSACLRAI